MLLLAEVVWWRWWLSCCLAADPDPALLATTFTPRGLLRELVVLGRPAGGEINMICGVKRETNRYVPSNREKVSTPIVAIDVLFSQTHTHF